jgi:PRTRC genetic system protein E
MPKTNFFQGLEALQIKGTIKIVLRLSADRTWTGSILVIDPELKDPAVKTLPPLSFVGTSEELGEGFFDALKAPLQKTTALFTNVSHYETQVAEAEKAAKMNQPATTGKATKPADPTDRKFQDRMKKVEALEKAGKVGEAIGAMPKESDFPNQSAAIKAKLEALKQKHGGFSLFETGEAQSPATDEPEELDSHEEPEEDSDFDEEPDEEENEE